MRHPQRFTSTKHRGAERSKWSRLSQHLQQKNAGAKCEKFMLEDKSPRHIIKVTLTEPTQAEEFIEQGVFFWKNFGVRRSDEAKETSCDAKFQVP